MQVQNNKEEVPFAHYEEKFAAIDPAEAAGRCSVPFEDGKFTVKVEYISCGSLEGKTLLLVDPMLATGSSLVLTYNALCEKGGTPAHTHVAAVVASEQGLDYAMKNMPRQTTTIWTAVVDEELTSRSYIVPGIGDAGDLAYGEKI